MKSNKRQFPTNYPKNIRLERPLVYLDLETTGLDVNADRIVSVAIIKCYPPTDTIPAHVDVYKTLVNPQMPIPTEASLVHGITDKDVKDYYSIAVYAPTILYYLKDADIAGFNHIKYDIPLLQNELKRVGHELDIEGKYLIDASVLFRKQHPRTLQKAYEIYCNKQLHNAHTAIADTEAVVEIIDQQVKCADGLRNPTVADLAYYQFKK